MSENKQNESMENTTKPKQSQQTGTGILGDLSKLRIKQNFNETVGVKKATLHVPVRKPTRSEFFRVHPSEQMRIPVAMIDMKEDREIFLVSPELAAQMPGEVQPKLLVTAINRQGVLFLWPLNLDLGDGSVRKNHWAETARTAADLATKGWVKMSANMSLGAYEVFEASGAIPDPEWPELSYQRILEIAFKDNFITDPNHIVIRKLMGAV